MFRAFVAIQLGAHLSSPCSPPNPSSSSYNTFQSNCAIKWRLTCKSSDKPVIYSNIIQCMMWLCLISWGLVLKGSAGGCGSGAAFNTSYNYSCQSWSINTVNPAAAEYDQMSLAVHFRQFVQAKLPNRSWAGSDSSKGAHWPSRTKTPMTERSTFIKYYTRSAGRIFLFTEALLA